MTDHLNELIRLKIERAGAPADAADALAMLLRSRLNVLDSGAVQVLGPHGEVRVGGGPLYGDMSLDEAVAELASQKPSLFGRTVESAAPAEPPAPAKAEVPPNETVTARVLRESKERRDARGIAKAAAPHSNPWAPGSINVTMQILTEHRNPDLAARLKSEAAAIPVSIVGRK